MTSAEKHNVLHNYLRSIEHEKDRGIDRFWLIAHTKRGKELIGSVTPLKDTNIFVGLDGVPFSSLDRLLIDFADRYFPNEVESTNENINGRRYYSLFGSFKTYDKVEILETGDLLSEIPGMG